MAFDPSLAKVVLLGGIGGAQMADPNEPWIWDGTDWSPLALSGAPSGLYGHAMVFDPTIGRTAAARGQLDGERDWSRHPPGHVVPRSHPGRRHCYGTACPGPAGGPRLLLRGAPRVPNGRGSLDVDLLPAAAPVALLFSSNPASVLLGGGCSLLVSDPTITIGAICSGLGFAAVPYSLPPGPRSARQVPVRASRRGRPLGPFGVGVEPRGRASSRATRRAWRSWLASDDRAQAAMGPGGGGADPYHGAGR
jgi:hypothetical protein